MTKMVQIRNVPDDMHRELRARAARAGMSLSDYLRQELERLVSRPPMAEVLARAEARSTGLTTADVVAAVRALTSPAANCWTNCATTNNPSQVIVINGPVRTELDVRCTKGLLGPGNRATATIGRALGLVVRNVLGAVPGGLDQSVFSFPGRYSICFAENEDDSPWVPLHAERGLAPDQSAVTVFGAMPMLLVRPSLTAGPDDIIASCAMRLKTFGSPRTRVARSTASERACTNPRPDVKEVVWNPRRSSSSAGSLPRSSRLRVGGIPRH